MNSPLISCASFCPLSLVTVCFKINAENVGLQVMKKKSRYIDAVSFTAFDFLLNDLFNVLNSDSVKGSPTYVLTRV